MQANLNLKLKTFQFLSHSLDASFAAEYSPGHPVQRPLHEYLWTIFLLKLNPGPCIG